MAKPPDWEQPPSHKPKASHGEGGWAPALNPTQQKLFEDSAKFVLAYGEKGSGKSVACGHALVRHCWENKDAFAIIIALSIRVGKEGILYDMENLILPAWRDGNRHPEWINGTRHPKAGELMDEGMGLEYTNSQQDPDTKDRVIWIANRHGGWSKVLLISIPYAEAVEARIKGPAPSFVYVEEITNCSSEEYFNKPSAQLGRRRGVELQQFYASCNPEGPSHWVYKTWWVTCVNEDTGRRDPEFSVHHVPIKENIDRLQPGYVEHLKKLFKDPIEKRRLIDGEWVDRPSGESIFRNFFFPEIHVRGDALKGIGLHPIKGVPIIIGMDAGPVNFSVHFEQFVQTKEKSIWLVFDELNFVGTYTPYYRVVPMILKRMDYWKATCGSDFRFIQIAGEDAFNQVRSDGSYDSAEIERLSQGRMKLRACPMGKQSVPQRVQMTISMLLEESLFISATCPKTLDMMRMLVSKKADPGKYEPNQGLTPMKSVYLHPFDSMTYPIYYFQLLPGRLPTNTGEVKNTVYACGSAG